MESEDEYDQWAAKDEDDLDESQDDDLEMSEPGTSSSVLKKKENTEDFPYEVLTAETILKHMNDIVDEVHIVLNQPPHIIRILLRYFNWDKEKLLEKFFTSDPEELFETVQLPKTQATCMELLAEEKSLSLEDNNNPDPECCGICFNDYDSTTSNYMHGLSCGHRFCTECWKEHVRFKIMNEGSVQMINCPHAACDAILDDEGIRELVTDSNVLDKYKYLLASDFVECNRLMRWCPSPKGCSNVIKAEFVTGKAVTCNCGFRFCFQCSLNCHEPIRCDLMKKWDKKCSDNSETGKWIHVNTKACPNCKLPIEKNGGCNFMYCASCKHQFCWVCLKATINHHCCNTYRDDDTRRKTNSTGKDEKAKAKILDSLHRYLFFYDRYMNQKKSLEFEGKLRECVQLKMDNLIQQNVPWIDVQFLKQAVDTLCNCRQNIVFTFCFAYFLKKSSHQTLIFENNQGDVLQATEVLSGILENKDFNTGNICEMKQSVQDKCSYCVTRLQILLDHIDEGYEKSWWEFIS